MEEKEKLEKPLHDATDAVRLLNVPRATLYELVGSRGLPHHRVDESVVGVLPVLREREISDPTALYRAWKEAGEPEPTAEEIEEYEARIDAEEPIWAGKTRPPALALQAAVPDRKRLYYKK